MLKNCFWVSGIQLLGVLSPFIQAEKLFYSPFTRAGSVSISTQREDFNSLLGAPRSDVVKAALVDSASFLSSVRKIDAPAPAVKDPDTYVPVRCLTDEIVPVHAPSRHRPPIIRTIMTTNTADTLRLDNTTIHRIAPFILFMVFIAIEEALRFSTHRQWLTLPDSMLYYLYPLKAVSVGLLLYKYKDQYKELRLKDLLRLKTSAAVCGLGLVTFVIWISVDWMLSLTAPTSGFNPTLLPQGPVRGLMTTTRVAGAVCIVPIMEELFWRSFLLRYLIEVDFASVPIGRFTWSSFLICTVLFGLEHHLFFAGMIAGAVYNVILYTTRSLAQCILAHAITNLALACYVLYTGRWYFW